MSQAAIRLLLVGEGGGAFAEAASLARAAGASVALVFDEPQAIDHVADNVVDLVMIDVARDVAGFVGALKARGIRLPVLGCGVAASAEQAVRAIRGGALDYVPLPPDPQMIGAALAAASVRDAGGSAAPPPADPEEAVHALVGRTIEEVERALILETLERARGNRTAASAILGISVRTMRNKLKMFGDDGYDVARPQLPTHAGGY